VNRLWVLVAVLGLALTGCQLAQPAEADPAEFRLDQEFTLAGGQEAVISGENLRLRFTEVLDDSRCPAQVDCVWTGQARIAIVVRPEGREPTTVEFTTSPALSQNKDTAEVDGYTIWLRSLDPYPQTTAAIPFEEYRATVTVRKRAP
jgi:hypothetical protein